MGMFDSVMLKCPACNAEHEAQSKSGPCLLDEYTLENAPDVVMQDVNRHAPFECACGYRIQVDTALRRCFDVRPYDRRAALVMQRFERSLTDEEEAELKTIDEKLEAEESKAAAPGLAKLEALARKYEDLAEAVQIAVEITKQNVELQKQLDAVTAERDALIAKKL